MRRSAAVLCQDTSTLQRLKAALEELGIQLVTCHSGPEAMELAVSRRCSTLIVDFDLAGAGEIIKMAALLAPAQKPLLLAVSSRAWPGTGQAFQSGADRILYKPLDPAELKDACATRRPRARDRRKAARREMKTVVYFELETGTLPAIGIDISEHGFAVQATESFPMLSNLAFRCVLPGSEYELHGRADVMWASDHGRAGLFFSKLAASARKQLKQWLRQRGPSKDKDAVRILVAPVEPAPSLAASE